MKILQINKYYWPKGGADKYALDLSQLLESHGHQVIPFAMEHENNLPTPYAKYFVSNVDTQNPKVGIKELKTFLRLMYSRETCRNLRKLIQHERPDVAHVHNVYTQLSPSVFDVLREEGIPVVMTIHDYHMISPNYMQWVFQKNQNLRDQSLLRLTLKKFHKDSYLASFAQALAFKFHKSRKSYENGVDRFIAPSEFVREEHVSNGFERKQIEVIPHFTQLAEEMPRYEDKGYILFYGRLVSEKGVDVLLRAMQTMPGVPCKIVGTGPEEVDLHIVGDAMPNVTFEGYESGQALWDMVRGARAVIVPSLWKEIFGLVAIEAMALGKPVIASDIGSLPDVIEDRKTGFLVRPGDVKELREAIARLAGDTVLATKMGRAGRRRVEKEFSAEVHYERIMSVYESVVEEGS